MDSTEISVVGLGKLGACLASTFANAGMSTTGIDIDEQVVDTIEAGESPLVEPQLQEYIQNAGSNLRATTSFDAVAETDVTFIVVNTPSTASDRYSLEYVEPACRSIGEAIREKDDYHLVVLTSTVFPGATEGQVQEWLETAAGKSVGEDIGLCYSPEFIAIGDVIDGLERPDFFLVGQADERSGDVLEEVYRTMRKNEAPIVQMDPKSAEIAKMGVNAYVTMKISFANTLAEICDGIGGDVDDITAALAQDSRISSDYLTAGGRFGGPCFPRDNAAFAQLADDAGTAAPLAQATDEVNERHTEWIADKVLEVTPSGGTVTVLGLTYKPDTYIVEESQGTALIEALPPALDVRCYDPMGIERARGVLAGQGCTVCESMTDALDGTDTAVITIPWDEFDDLEPDSAMTVVDPWRILDHKTTETYHPVGIAEGDSGSRLAQNTD